MFNRIPDCLAEAAPTDGRTALPLHALRPAGLAAFLDGLPVAQAAFLRAAGFAAKAGSLQLLPGPEGLAGAVLGLGDDRTPYVFGRLAQALPENTIWHLAPGEADPNQAALGFALGAYEFGRYKTASRAPARLLVPEGTDAIRLAQAVWLVRDLVNTPANDLGPAELAGVACDVAAACGAEFRQVDGAALAAAYPAIDAVGAGAARPPVVAAITWHGNTAAADAPLIAICGKGVCFDTGGLDLKPSSAMLTMKKDMGGAAITLALAQLIMQADLPVRLVARIGCVENSVSGAAMRPMDVIRTRQGLRVEIGNTDAEGRLVLADLLAEAAAESPALLMDFATLTGAARVALGPDLPALFCNDDDWASRLLAAGTQVHDPLWRLPLHGDYDDWLKSPVADLNNVSSKPFAGAIVAGLFLQRFVPRSVAWAHVDTYCWNAAPRPGRPEGGEAQSLRAAFAAIQQAATSPRFHVPVNDRNRRVT